MLQEIAGGGRAIIQRTKQKRKRVRGPTLRVEGDATFRDGVSVWPSLFVCHHLRWSKCVALIVPFAME